MARVLHNVVGLIGLLAITVPSSGIRVYWNTNTGPIVPPTSTPAPVPQPPFRDPAPVWEDQRDDVPNPNPYVYMLPSPSRPKYNDITAQRKQNQQEYSTAAPSQPSQPAAPTTSTPVTPSVNQTPTQATNTGRIIERPAQVPSANNNQYQNQNHLSRNDQQIVPSLAVRYVPNQGLKYYAVVPVIQNGVGAAAAAAPGKTAYLKTNDAQLGKEYERYPEKPNGRYNAKLKKYKAYEKVKYVPYYVYFDGAKQQYILSSLAPKTALPGKTA
uniref:Putative serine/threonine-protein kinase pakg n=1 Tax=Culex tarsalis TaxID=7177 RepID=A0A1Q3FRA8_CULTA